MSARSMRLMSWLLAAVALVLVRTFWCRLHGTATGGGAVDFAIAVPWGVKAAAGWLLAGALLARFGRRMLESEFAERHSGIVLALLLAGMPVITLGSETWLLAGDQDLALWIYERLPPHLTFAGLLLGGYLLSRGRRSTSPAAVAEVSPLVEVMTGTGRTRVRIDEIECLEADRNYVSVHTRERSYLLRQTLTSLEKSLQPDAFLRVHRSTIVNRAMIRERRPGGVLVMCSGRKVRVSRAFAESLDNPMGLAGSSGRGVEEFMSSLTRQIGAGQFEVRPRDEDTA